MITLALNVAAFLFLATVAITAILFIGSLVLAVVFYVLAGLLWLASIPLMWGKR